MATNRTKQSGKCMVVLAAVLIGLPLVCGCGAEEVEPKTQVDIEKSRQEHINVSKREQIES